MVTLSLFLILPAVVRGQTTSLRGDYHNTSCHTVKVIFFLCFININVSTEDFSVLESWFEKVLFTIKLQPTYSQIPE